jgi:ABC-type amino acid transport substrate-binding protein
MKLKTRILAGLMALCIAAAFTACGSDTNKKEAAKPDEAKVLRIATNATYVPFEFKDKDANGSESDYKGMEIDMIREVAKRLNMKPQMENIPFNGIIPAIQSKSVDIAATGMTMTKERAKKVCFAAPFYESKLAIVVPMDSTVKSVADLKGQTVAVMVGTTGAKYAQSHGINVKQFDNSATALLEVQVGNAPAAIVDKPVGEYFSTIEGKGKGKVRIIPIPDSKSELLGFVLNKDDKDLQQKVNKAIADMKKDGTYAKIYKKWFNADAPDLPESAEKALGL